MKVVRIIPIMVLALSAVLVTTGVAGAATRPAHHTHPYMHSYTCTGGNIAPGFYDSVIVTGVCYMPAGTIVIRRDLIVAPGALLDATSPGDPAGSPAVPATVHVGRNVIVGAGAALLIGCSPNIICPTGISDDTIGGSLYAPDALGVVVHSTSIGGNASLDGGGSGLDGAPAGSGACFAVAPPAPWSEDPNLTAAHLPPYSDFEDNSIGGSLSIVNVQTCWMGSLRNEVGGSVTYSDDATSDPDGMEMADNLIGGNLSCDDNDPAVQFGDSGAAPDVVRGTIEGQCDVLQPNPAAEALEPVTSVNEPIAVSRWSLRTYFGTYTQSAPSAVFPPIAVPDQNETLVGQASDATLAGSGLTGSLTYDSSLPLGSSGQVVLSTVHPNGSSSFSVYDTCSCTFDGYSGLITIRGYGTTSPSGWTRGTFLVASGGSYLAASPLSPFGTLGTVLTSSTDGLDTLAGYGTFAGSAGTLFLVEHLGIT